METQDKRKNLMTLRRLWAEHGLDSLFTITAQIGGGVRIDEFCCQIVCNKK